MISIIIPVYNTSKYLDQCFQSVLNQTYADWECIIVDDGSTDNSGEICDNWGKKDNRFIIIHQKNQGVSAARNQGIKKSKGKYLCFIDSDDWVNPTYLFDMINVIDDEMTDMVVTGLIHEKSSSSEKHLPQKEERIILNNNSKSFIDNVGLFYGPTAILYKKEVIINNGIQFPENISFGEDTIFNYNYLNVISYILLRPVANYHYRILSNTLSSSSNTNRPFLRYDLWKMRKGFYQKREMWNVYSQTDMFRELWAIIYDGIFSTNKVSITYLKNLLSIKEINELHHWKHIFKSPEWIKFLIIKRAYFLFFCYKFILRL